MAVRHTKILGLDFTFVFRHRYEKGSEEELLKKMTMWSEWELGFFFKRYMVVGKKNFNKPKEWGNNLCNEYMLGVNLLICKAWFTVSKGTMNLNINKNKNK